MTENFETENDVIDVSLDIETLDLTESAIVLQIAACTYDSEFNLYLHMLDQAGKRTFDPGTLLWHVEDHPQLFLDLVTHAEREGQSVDFVFDQLRIWFDEVETANPDSELVVWMNSPSFDGAILKHMANQFEEVLPWTYRQERDLRTLKDMAKRRNAEQFEKLDQIVPPLPEAHNAIADATYQLNVIGFCKTILNC